MWRLIHVNLSKKKKNSKNFVSEHLQKKKTPGKGEMEKEQKKLPLQKQKQFASGQPCNGCNALDRNKKQKHKTTTTNLLDCSKPSEKTKETTKWLLEQILSMADALSDFFPTVFIVPGKS